jgi:hypothetical protein
VSTFGERMAEIGVVVCRVATGIENADPHPVGWGVRMFSGVLMLACDDV